MGKADVSRKVSYVNFLLRHLCVPSLLLSFANLDILDEWELYTAYMNCLVLFSIGADTVSQIVCFPL